MELTKSKLNRNYLSTMTIVVGGKHMNNLMAKDMTQRYEEYLYTVNLEERAAKIIYFWTMSTLESFFEALE